MEPFRGLTEDLRYAFRTIRLNPGFACVAVLSLALGIGANTAIFSLIDAIMLRTLPVEDPASLVLLTDPTASGVSVGSQDGVRSLVSFEEYRELRDRTSAFSGLFAAESNLSRVYVRTGDGPVEEVLGKLVTGNYFQVLGVQPAIGRVFTEAEDKSPGSAPLAVMGYDYWKRRYALDASVVGRTIQVNRNALTIVGVAPPGFHGETVGDSPDLYVPMMMEPLMKRGRDWLHDDPTRAEKVMWLQMGGRLKPGVSMAAAQSGVDGAFKQYLQVLSGYTADPERKKSILNQQLKLTSGAKGASYLRDEASQPLTVLMSIVGLVLLIACANVANLLLARATSRQREISVRLALGATRRRLVRQLLTESLVLSFLGGAAGVIFAFWAGNVLVRLASGGPKPIPLDLHVDLRMLAFTAALSILTGILFGLIPALRTARADVNPALKDNARGVTGSGAKLNLGKLLVVTQVAISLLLLIGAGLFVRTLTNLQSAELGYTKENLLVVRVDPVSGGYKGQAMAAYYRRVLDELKAIPGVRGVTLSENGLFSGTESMDQITVEGYHSKNEADLASRYDMIGPGYFSTLGVPILMGREIGPQDTAGAPLVCVVNEAFAKFYFGKENPLGKHVTDEFPDTRATCEIVGVARDLKDHRVRGDIPRRFYLPLFHPIGEYPPAANYELRTMANPESLMPSIRRRLEEIDSAVPIIKAGSVTDNVYRSIRQERMIAQLAAFFGALALLLSAIGLYGVLAYNTTRRTHEIGIRMALGAAQGSVLRQILREALILAVVGVAIGLPLAYACGRLLQSALYGLAVLDPWIWCAAVLAMMAVAAAAGFIPARRASRVDPVRALRYE
jgi:predicted permease